MSPRPLTGPPCGCQLARVHEDDCPVGQPVPDVPSCACPALTVTEVADWAQRDSCPCRHKPDQGD